MEEVALRLQAKIHISKFPQPLLERMTQSTKKCRIWLVCTNIPFEAEIERIRGGKYFLWYTYIQCNVEGMVRSNVL